MTDTPFILRGLSFEPVDKKDSAGSFGRVMLRLEASYELGGKTSELEMDVTWEQALALADQIRRHYELCRDQSLLHILQEIRTSTKSAADSAGGIFASTG